MGSKARKSIETKFNIDNVVNIIEESYKNINEKTKNITLS